jgi:hypothetical protein
MRVLINGKHAEALDAGRESQITLSARRDVVEGAVMSAEESVARIVKRLKLSLGFFAAFCTAILVAILFAADPRDLVILAPLATVLAIGVATYLAYLYRKGAAKVRGEAEPRLARMAAPGTTVRVDDAGLTVAGRSAAWSAIAIDTVEITRISTIKAPLVQSQDPSLIAALLLTVQGDTVVLDSGAIENGQSIVDNAWRRLRPA